MSQEERPPLSLEEARARLKELGYLDGRVERYLFRRAFEGRGGLLMPAVLLGDLAAALASLAAAAAAEPGFGRSPAAVLSLLLHLGLADLVPAAVLGLAVAGTADRSRSPGPTSAALALGLAGLIFFLWIGGTYALAREFALPSLLWGVPVAIAVFLFATSVRSGFLARAYAHSRVVPGRRRGRILAVTAAAGILLGALLLALRREDSEVTAPRPSPRRERLAVIAVDGLGLDSREREPAAPVRALLDQGATGWWLAKDASPPEIWTDLATGAPASVHGVRALERVRPLGSPLALRPPLGTGWYLRRLGPALGLVSSAPVSAADRGAVAFWEVAASAGLPALSVGWWASGPWPGATVMDNRELLSGARDGLEVNEKAMAAYRKGEGSAGLATVYLPGADILREDPARRAEALARLADFLRGEIARARRGEIALAVLAAESHPAPGALGRLVVFDGASPKTMRIRSLDVAPSLLARAGIPAARDLPGRPAAALFREGSLDTGSVESYGARIAPRASASRQSDQEYLEKLRSLGYMN